MSRYIEMTPIIEREGKAKMTARFVLRLLMLKSPGQHKIHDRIESICEHKVEKRSMGSDLFEPLAARGLLEGSLEQHANVNRLLLRNMHDVPSEHMMTKVLFDGG